MKLFILFCVLNTINVVLQTVKSIVTINSGKWTAAFMNAVAFGLYQVILVYAVCELPLAVKVIVVAVANFIGVFVTKLLQEKMRKDRLWKVEFAIPISQSLTVDKELTDEKVSHNIIRTNDYDSFHCFCPTQNESQKVKNIVDKYGAKYFVTESKIL